MKKAGGSILWASGKTTWRRHRAAIADAKTNGFHDCNDVFAALGIAPINAGGIRRVPYQVAYRWIRDAGVEWVKLVPDGSTDLPLAERAGCYDLDAVVAAKEAFYADLRAREKASSDAALARQAEFERQKEERAEQIARETGEMLAEHRATVAQLQGEASARLYVERWTTLVGYGMLQDAIFDALGPVPEGVDAEDLADAPADRDEQIVRYFMNYDGALGRGGRAKGRVFCGVALTGERKRRLWAEAMARKNGEVAE